MNGAHELTGADSTTARSTEEALGALRRLIHEKDLTKWLLGSFKDHDFAPLLIPDTRDPVDYLRVLFLRLSGADQEVFRESLVTALAHWEADPRRVDVLWSLAFLARYTTATESIPIFQRYIEQDFPVRTVPSNQQDIREVLIAIVGGMPPTKEARDALHRLFWHPRLSPEFAGNIYVALLGQSPADYHRYLPRVLGFASHYSETRRPGYLKRILERSLELVGHETFFSHLSNMPHDVARSAMDLIGWDQIITSYQSISPETAADLTTIIVRVIGIKNACAALRGNADLLHSLMANVIQEGRFDLSLSAEFGMVWFHDREEGGAPYVLDDPEILTIVQPFVYDERNLVDVYWAGHRGLVL